MKAVYETPRVSFEAFAANNAVSVCGWETPEFDCVLGDGVRHDDKHGNSDVPYKSLNLISSSLLTNTCSVNAGFADYVNGDWTEDSVGNSSGDNITNTQVSGNINVRWNTGEITKNDSNHSFMGWLYLSFVDSNKHPGWAYDTTGWKIQNNRLSFHNQKKIRHAWLAPLFGSRGSSY